MKLRVGILGCASIAKRSLIPAFTAHPSFELKAIASRSLDKVTPLATQYHCRTCTYDELVSAEDIDLIYCPLPTGLHAGWVKRCLEADKHVLCEKSLACTFDDVKILVETAKAHNRFLMESFQFRFHSQNLLVKKMLAEGHLGEIRCVRVSFGFPPFPDRETNIRYKESLGGGALLDAGAYTIKATTFLLGPDVKVLGATSWTACGFEVDLGGTIYLQNSQGIVSETAYGFDNFYQCGYEIWGSKAKLTLKRAFTAPPGFAPTMIVESSAGVKSVALPSDDHFLNLLSHIRDSISSDDLIGEYRECLMQGKLLGDVCSCNSDKF